MRKSVKAKWIKALRSGKYHQCEGLLKEDITLNDGTEAPGYCCLGVLAEVAGLEEAKIVGGAFFGGPDSDGDWEVPELETRKLIGTPLPKGYVDKLAGFNDGKAMIGNKDGDAWSFKRIASWIEKSARI